VPVFILSLKRRLCEMQGLFLFFTGAYHVFRESIVYVVDADLKRQKADGIA
jgi:hypothetical protein